MAPHVVQNSDSVLSPTNSNPAPHFGQEMRMLQVGQWDGELLGDVRSTEQPHLGQLMTVSMT